MSAIASARRALKSVPILVELKQGLWRYPGAVVAAMVRLFCLPFLRLRRFRGALFDASPGNSLLLSSVSPEVYVVSANDRMIGRPTYTTGSFDLEKFERTVNMLGNERNNNLLVDIGANIGTICIPAVRRGLFHRAIAFEPEPFNFSLLSANIHLNGLSDRITAHNVALGSQTGQTLDFELSRHNYGDHRILLSTAACDGRADRAGIIKVRSETLDLMLAMNSPEETLVWMDTQGFEGHILKGSANTMKSLVPMVVEFWPHGMKRVASYHLMKEALLAAGYRMFYDLSEPRTPQPVQLSGAALDRLYRKLGEDEWMMTDLLIR